MKAFVYRELNFTIFNMKNVIVILIRNYVYLIAALVLGVRGKIKIFYDKFNNVLTKYSGTIYQ